jgi:ribosomal protein L17
MLRWWTKKIRLTSNACVRNLAGQLLQHYSIKHTIWGGKKRQCIERGATELITVHAKHMFVSRHHQEGTQRLLYR